MLDQHDACRKINGISRNNCARVAGPPAEAPITSRRRESGCSLGRATGVSVGRLP